MRVTHRHVAVACALLGACGVPPHAGPGADPTGSPGAFEAEAVASWSEADAVFFKGNTHTHTANSDGDSPPEYVARWYREHGYAFLVLSDHNVFTDPLTLAHLTGDDFLLIPGEEVTSSFDGRPVHVNGLGVPDVVEPRRAETMVATLQANVDAIREVEGVPHVNHPNFGWAITAEELARVERDRLFEVFNGHPTVHNVGGGGRPGLEVVWDRLLTGGKRMYGVAVDDAHHFQGEFSADRANPGRAWVVVKAAALEAADILSALEGGRFYASTGVDLENVVVASDRLEVHVAERGDFRYTTTFVGAGGRTLGSTGENPAVYRLRGGERYVRAKVVDSGGAAAWVQPLFVAGGTS